MNYAASCSGAPAGVNIDWTLFGHYSLSADVERQLADRGFSDMIVEKFINSFASLTFSAAPQYSIPIVAQRSDDPATPLVTETSARTWVALAGACQLDMNHEVSFFYGARRGGLACTSGTCNEVLPFEGFELRWTAHFQAQLRLYFAKGVHKKRRRPRGQSAPLWE